jgi:exonuclease SbcC
MNIEQITIRNFGPFTDTTINIADIPGRIVAVTGPNGAGKSTFLELIPGALYRETPTRGALKDLATSRRAYMEMRLNNGVTYTVSHSVDASNGKSDALIVDAQNAAVLRSSKVSEFDGWSKAHFPSPEVYYSSVFAAQGSGGFLDAKPGDRKAILLRVLGIERFEMLASRSRESERKAREVLAGVNGQLVSEQRRSVDVADARASLVLAREAARCADVELEAAKVELSRVENDVRVVEQARAALQLFSTRQNELGEKRREVSRRVADLETKISNNRKVLSEAEVIRQAVAESEALREEIGNLEAKRVNVGRDLRESEQSGLAGV